MIALRRFLTTNFATFLLLATVIAGCFIIYVDVRQSMHKAVWDPNDFVTLYAGAICTNSGCKPYSVPDLDTVLRQKRDTATLQDWTDQLPIYPPTTIFLLKPLARLCATTEPSRPPGWTLESNNGRNCEIESSAEAATTSTSKPAMRVTGL